MSIALRKVRSVWLQAVSPAIDNNKRLRVTPEESCFPPFDRQRGIERSLAVDKTRTEAGDAAVTYLLLLMRFVLGLWSRTSAAARPASFGSGKAMRLDRVHRSRRPEAFAREWMSMDHVLTDRPGGFMYCGRGTIEESQSLPEFHFPARTAGRLGPENLISPSPLSVRSIVHDRAGRDFSQVVPRRATSGSG